MARRKSQVDDDRIIIAVDVKSRRPGCVLLQAVYGGDSHFVGQHFHSDHWLVAPTDNMRMFAATPEQWKELARQLDAERRPDAD